MSDQTPDATLVEETPDGSQLPTALQRPDVDQAVKNILTLDAVLNSARLVERTATICIRGDLVDEHERLWDELSGLINERGEVLGNPEASLYNENVERAQELQEQIRTNEAAQREASYLVRFRAMPSDEWEAFEQENRADNGRGPAKDKVKYENKVIARCAIEPTLTVDDVIAMRKKLTAPMIAHLFVTAYEACTQGGVDVPKSLPFSVAPKQP